jgi:hypothetical protein
MNNERNASPGKTAKAPQKKRPAPIIGRKELLVIGGIWLAGCVLVAGLVGVFYYYRAPGEANPLPPSPPELVNIPFSGTTAKTAYLSALTKAQDWSADVQLVSLSADWRNAAPPDLGQVAVWDFNFFSPEHGRIFLASVIQGQPPTGRAHPFKIRRPPRIVSPEAWLIDSDQAASIWLSNGGNTFLETYPENQVEILFRQGRDSNTPVWSVIGTNLDQSYLFYLMIDAQTGNILNTN